MSWHGKWTSIYWDIDPSIPADAGRNRMRAYVRFTPPNMDLSATGFSHGISISGCFFDTEKEAIEHAKILEERFFDKMKEAIIEDYLESVSSSITS